MQESLTEVLSKLKKNWTRVVNADEVEQICRSLGLCWRDRILGPAQTVQLFVLQILHGNTALSHVRLSE